MLTLRRTVLHPFDVLLNAYTAPYVIRFSDILNSIANSGVSQLYVRYGNTHKIFIIN